MLIIGGAGFIGATLTKQLINMGSEVIILDKFHHGTAHFDPRNYSQVKVIDINLNSSLKCMAILEGLEFDFTFHLAANSDVKTGSQDKTLDYSDTLLTTLNLNQISKVTKLGHVVFASSSAIFGVGQISWHEKSNMRPVFPISTYGECKLISEELLVKNLSDGNFEKLSIVRFPNVVGEHATHGILFDFANQYLANKEVLYVLGDGTQTKPYLLVTELVSVILDYLNSAQASILTLNYLNLSPSDTISVKDIVRIFCEEFNYQPKVVFGDQPFGWVGDVPKYSFAPNQFTEMFNCSSYAIRAATKLLYQEERFRSGNF